MPIRHFLQFVDFDRAEIEHVFERARIIKDLFKRYRPYHPLADRTLVMIFEKPSTRTRLSFEAGIHQMGGAAVFLSSDAATFVNGHILYVDGAFAATV